MPLCWAPDFALGSYFAAARPILAVVRDDSPTATALARSGAGLAISPNDPRELAERIATLQEQPALRSNLGRRGQEYAQHKLDPRQALQKLTTLITEAITRFPTDHVMTPRPT